MKDHKIAKHYAHRGYHEPPHIPENSMAAFRRAVEHGVGVEFDVHQIADGSLVIFHDDDLERMTGVKGQIEDYDLTNLRKLRLKGTDEKIPTFDELLDLFEDTGLPLCVEIKPARGNYRPLTEAVCKRLDSYKGDFVVESFDPRALIVLKRLRPEWTRGQLVQDFYKNPDGLTRRQAALLTNLAFNRFVKPDFVAFRFKDKMRPALRRALEKKGITAVAWTIRSAKEYDAAVKKGCIPIFERITPEELESLKREK